LLRFKYKGFFFWAMAEKPSGKSEKPAEKPKKSGVFEWLAKALKNALVASVVFIVLVFILGEVYAFYALKTGSALVLWLPVFVLVAVLFYKVID